MARTIRITKAAGKATVVEVFENGISSHVMVFNNNIDYHSDNRFVVFQKEDRLSSLRITPEHLHADTKTLLGNPTDADEIIVAFADKEFFQGFKSALGGSGASSADAVSVDQTNLKSFIGADVQAIIEYADIGFTNARSTGVGSGGNLTDLGAGVVRILAGAGSIIANPNYTQLAWAQTDLNLSAVDDVYYIYVNNTNTVLSTTVAPTNADYRNNVWLWRVSIRGGVLVGKLPIPQPLQQVGPQLRDAFVAMGQKKTGLVINSGGANLSFAYGTGSIYFPGANFYNDANNPHEVAISALSPVTFQHVDQNNIRTAATTLLDVGNYDAAGTITAIPGSTSRATIFSIFLSPISKNVRVVYGQDFYANLGEAFNALNSGTYAPIIPEQIQSATIQIGWIIAQKGATNLADGNQIFITANRDGTIGGSISSTGANPLLAANNGSDVLDSALFKTNIEAVGNSLTGEPTGSDKVLNIVSLTQAEYNAGTPIATTFYVIVG